MAKFSKKNTEKDLLLVVIPKKKQDVSRKSIAIKMKKKVNTQKTKKLVIEKEKQGRQKLREQVVFISIIVGLYVVCSSFSSFLVSLLMYISIKLTYFVLVLSCNRFA